MAVAVDIPGQMGFFDGMDATNPEYIKQLLRPAAIKEDVKLMEQRRRVSLILQSPSFSAELEKIVASQMRSGELSANVMALKQLVDWLTPHTKLGSSTFMKCATVPVIPINDVRPSAGQMYSKSERVMRCKLAAAYRLMDVFGWNGGVTSQLSTRASRQAEEYLISPTGLLFHEVTASSLMKVDLKGNVLDHGMSMLSLDEASWTLHSAVYEARPDLRCVIHLSTPGTLAVSCMKSGLLPVSQEAMILGEVASYDPIGALTVAQADGNCNGDSTSEDYESRRQRHASEEHATIGQTLTSHSAETRLVIIRNQGILVCGQSVEEAWMLASLTISACDSQLRLTCIGLEDLVIPSPEVCRQAFETVHRRSTASGSGAWRPGELEFEALMRRLDSAGYRTGHLYRIGQVRQSTDHRRLATAHPAIPEEEADGASMTPRQAAAYARRTVSLGRGLWPKSEVEIPPTTSSFADAYYKDAATRAEDAAAHKLRSMSLQRTHWLNTPNLYQREEIEEIGTAYPKKITYWTEGDAKTGQRTAGISLPIVNPNQFAPQGSDPQELRANLKKVKAKYYQDVKTAGPQSKILDGIDQDDFDGFSTSPPISPRGTLLRLDPASPPIVAPGHVVVVGAASKGIINRDKRHDAAIFQSVYTPNPFDRITDEDLDRYKRNVDRKAKGMMTEEEEEALEEEKRVVAQLSMERELSRATAESTQRQAGSSHERPGSRLGVTDGVRSDTSAAEGSFDEGDVAQPSESTSKDKKKKRRFKMPSFVRKSKDKK